MFLNYILCMLNKSHIKYNNLRRHNMSKTKKFSIFMAAILCLAPFTGCNTAHANSEASQVIYTNVNATGNNDGTS